MLLLLVLFVELATQTSRGVSSDLGRAATAVPDAAREFLLAVTQIVAVAFPVLVVVAIVARRRWRRLGVVVLAAGAGAALFALLDALFDVGGSVRGAVTDGTWVASTDFPSLVYVAGAGAVVTAGKPWLGRSWRRCADLSLLVLVVVLAVAGTAGVPELLVAVAAGVTAGAAVLVGARRAEPPADPRAVADVLGAGGLAVDDLALERADGGRAQLYTAALVGGDRAFVKVYARDSRDADLLYRGYRTALLRGRTTTGPR